MAYRRNTRKRRGMLAAVVMSTGLVVAVGYGPAEAQISGVQLTARCGEAANQLHAKSTRDSGINAIVTGLPGDVELPRLNVPPGGEATIDVGKFEQVNVNAGRQEETVSFAQCVRSSTTVTATAPNTVALLAAAGQTATTVATPAPRAATPALATTGSTRLELSIRLATASFMLGLLCMFVTQRRRFRRIDAWLTWAFNSF